jgi:hypothetical protein
MEHLNNTATPSHAYDLLEQHERQAVDEYVRFAIAEQASRKERIALALNTPIPSEYVRRSGGVLARPLARAAVAERLQREAREQDLSPDRVIDEYAAIAFSNIADYMDVRPFGDFTVKPLDAISRSALSAVKSMKTIPSPYGIRTEITMYDKIPALEKLAVLMGLVAPDKPPPLADYSKPPAALAQNAVPEQAYVEYLEQGRV